MGYQRGIPRSDNFYQLGSNSPENFTHGPTDPEKPDGQGEGGRAKFFVRGSIEKFSAGVTQSPVKRRRETRNYDGKSTRPHKRSRRPAISDTWGSPGPGSSSEITDRDLLGTLAGRTEPGSRRAGERLAREDPPDPRDPCCTDHARGMLPARMRDRDRCLRTVPGAGSPAYPSDATVLPHRAAVTHPSASPAALPPGVQASPGTPRRTGASVPGGPVPRPSG